MDTGVVIGAFVDALGRGDRLAGHLREGIEAALGESTAVASATWPREGGLDGELERGLLACANGRWTIVTVEFSRRNDLSAEAAEVLVTRLGPLRDLVIRDRLIYFQQPGVDKVYSISESIELEHEQLPASGKIRIDLTEGSLSAMAEDVRSAFAEAANLAV